MAGEVKQTVKRVCVTGAAGYVGSWLVKNLLERGYTVNATLRDPGDGTKSGPLLELPGAKERLKLFKADLCLEGSFDSAVEGCQGVFHVAGPTDITKSNLDDFVVPAVNGVHNVMKACLRAKCVRRVIYTSSILAASPMNDNGEFIHTCVDESCWSPLNFLKSETNKLAWYMIAKTLAEQEALKYGLNSGIEVISILPGLVIGPWFTATSALTSAQTILALIGGNNEFYEVIKYDEFVLGSIPIVHIEDTCNAHIFVMECTNARNRYVCASDSLSLKSLKDFLAKQYVQFKNSLKLDKDEGVERSLPFSSKKLLEMGFSYKYHLPEAFQETMDCVIKNGLLKVMVNK
ncbi:putative anthocyanidin reductase [Cryptomeria japonica]|uniref:putative anthocyanidin reductase n=1 Tax=Cryptomeria japonica TaxID=3369 RepID=UPI0027DA4203|nr:putative anthocyanidin reductase [Cryptomeria japonica]